MIDRARAELTSRAHWYALGRVEAESGITGDPDARASSFALYVAENPKDNGRTMHDRWLQWTHGGRHWHVVIGKNDEDPLSTYDMVEALTYAADELERIAESEHDGAVGAAEAGDYEEAWMMHERAATWHGLVANLRNMAHQHAAEPADRAPMYQDPATAPHRLREALKRVLMRLDAAGPSDFAVYEHGDSHDECRPRPDGEQKD